MKHLRILIAVLLVLAMVAACFAACKKKTDGGAVVTVAVTDENGEPVTDENGQPVTEVLTTVGENGETVSMESGGSVISGGSSNNSSGGSNITTQKGASTTKNNGKSKGGTTTTTKPAEGKPAAPKTPGNFKVKTAKVNSIVLSWSKVDCSYYTIRYGKDKTYGQSANVDKSKNSVEITGLDSDTPYYFEIFAVNKNTAGSTQSSPARTNGKTEVDNSRKYRKIEVQLPMDSGVQDVLIVEISGKGQKETQKKNVELKGGPVEISSNKQYKGKVTITAKLQNRGNSCTITSDKDRIELDLTSGIDREEGVEPN